MSKKRVHVKVAEESPNFDKLFTEDEAKSMACWLILEATNTVKEKLESNWAGKPENLAMLIKCLNSIQLALLDTVFIIDPGLNIEEEKPE